MQFVEDYSEPQPSVFYQTPQSESIYEQRNRLIQEVYGFNDSFSSSDSVHEPLPPPALPPKQRQLVSSTYCTHSCTFSFPLTGTCCHTQHVNTPHVLHTNSNNEPLLFSCHRQNTAPCICSTVNKCTFTTPVHGHVC